LTGRKLRLAGSLFGWGQVGLGARRSLHATLSIGKMTAQWRIQAEIRKVSFLSLGCNDRVVGVGQGRTVRACSKN